MEEETAKLDLNVISMNTSVDLDAEDSDEDLDRDEVCLKEQEGIVMGRKALFILVGYPPPPGLNTTGV